MTPLRSHKVLVAGCLVAPVVVAGLFPVRDLLAAFFIFSIAFGAVAMIVLASFLFGGGVLRCYELLMACASWFGVRHQHP
jgi:hypothetical protein